MEQPQEPHTGGSSFAVLGQPIRQPAEESKLQIHKVTLMPSRAPQLPLPQLNSEKWVLAEDASLPQGAPFPFLTPAILVPCPPNQAPSAHLATQPLVDPAQGVEKREEGREEWEGGG